MTDIRINGLSKTIKKHTVIDNISMELKSGTVYGLKGINGSGKTMLMRLICGLIRPTQGDILINGKVLGKEVPFPGSIGVFLEEPAFLDAYSGFQNLKMLASIKLVANDAEIKLAMTRLGLNPTDKRKYKKYSLGMKQRLGISAAIMERPEILVLDEPTNALDENGITLVKKIIMEEKQRGTLLILSCHDINILQESSDIIFELHEGSISRYF